jgi:large subunit ribosomal protein L4
MKLKVLNKEGKATGREITLSDEVFGIEPNDHAIYLAVKQYQANQRQGTSKTLQKSEISGSTRKLHKQKGTGGSRKGSIKNPLFYGGPRVGGPKPRDYFFKLNKKVKDLARKSALSYKAKDNGVVIVEDFTLETPKTKEFIAILKGLGVDGKKILFLLGDNNKNIILSGRNLDKMNIENATDVNTYDILNSQVLVISESSVEKIENILNN